MAGFISVDGLAPPWIAVSESSSSCEAEMSLLVRSLSQNKQLSGNGGKKVELTEMRYVGNNPIFGLLAPSLAHLNVADINMFQVP